MDDVRDIHYKPLNDSIYLKPFRLHYTQNGVKKNWDVAKVHDSVAIILYNVTRKKLIFVKQFRPAVYYARVPDEDRDGTICTSKYPPKLGITIELCAGIVDKDKPVSDIAREEILEECGFDVPSKVIEQIISFRSGVGMSGATMTLFYCEVTDEMRVNQGGGVDDELIEVVEMTIPELKQYISQPDVNSPPGMLFAMHWFLLNKPQYNI